MNIYAVSAFALLCCVAAVILRKFSEPIAPLVSCVAVICITAAAIASIGPVNEFIQSLEGQGGYTTYYTVMLKGLGIAILAECASDICRDCGETSIASKVELCAKIAMLALSLPMLNAIIQLSADMMSQ